MISATAALVCVLVACKPQGLIGDSKSLMVDSETQDATFEILAAQQNTTLKKFMFDATVATSDERCPIPQGTTLTVDAIKPEGIQHWRVYSLSEIKLPSGEVARRVRVSNESAEASGSFSTQPEATATESPEVEPQPQQKSKTPAELLNCPLLESESFLVYAPHFSRQLKSISGEEGRPPSSNSSGSSSDFGWQWPTRGRTIRNDSGGSGYFNAPRASGRGHQGIDIVSAVGEAVHAARAGTIIDPSWEGAYGKVVDVRHGDDYLSRYAHLSSFSYSHGTYVEKGARIAASGRTGNASGYGITPHLHFEIRRGGRVINPRSLLP